MLIVLQGIDAGGKDGTIRNVMSRMNPQGVKVTAFKVPEGAEKRHDYLWRVHTAVPERRNRDLQPVALRRRAGRPRPQPGAETSLEEALSADQRLRDDAGRQRHAIIKFLLYISKEEQARRFDERLEDKTKNWKFSPADMKEREYWDQYMEAFEDVLAQVQHAACALVRHSGG